MSNCLYKNVIKGTFLSRPNRFIARVLVEGREETVHVKNTGRCRELLVPGAMVYLEPAAKERKTGWSLIGVVKDGRIVNIDSQVPNRVVEEALRSGRLLLPWAGDIVTIKREVTHGDSRFDLYFETEDQKGFIEVKGVTLEDKGIARFPDAPTERGTKHLNGLTEAFEEGYLCFVVFVIQMKGCTAFQPNWKTDPVFSEALVSAALHGVGVVAIDCRVGPDSIEMDDYVEVQL